MGRALVQMVREKGTFDDGSSGGPALIPTRRLRHMKKTNTMHRYPPTMSSVSSSTTEACTCQSCEEKQGKEPQTIITKDEIPDSLSKNRRLP